MEGLVLMDVPSMYGGTVKRWVKPRPKYVPGKKFYRKGYSSCCGGDVLVPIKEDEEWDDARWEREWISSGWKSLYDQYDAQSKAYGAKNDPYYRDYYNRIKSGYTIENFRKNYNKNFEIVEDTRFKGFGITVSDVEFHGAKQSSCGLWWNTYRAPINKATDDRFQAAQVVDFDALFESAREKKKSGGYYGINYRNNGPVRDGAKDLTCASIYSGFTPLTDTQTQPALMMYLLWARIIEGKHKVGDVVTFIVNQQQRNVHDVAEWIAKAGFTEVCRSGNSNHPTTSTIYLYERRLTEADLRFKPNREGLPFKNGQ